MAVYTDYTMKIAGYTVRFSLRYPLLAQMGKAYLCQSDICDFSICPTSADLSYELQKGQAPGCSTRADILESLACYRRFATLIFRDHAFVMHGAAVCVHGEGVMFMAPSGTGKTTHLRLWQQLLGKELTVINGDKPVVKLEDTQVTVYGTPFNGKEQYGTNTSAPLRHLCLITRSSENRTEPLSRREALTLLLQQTHIPEEPDAIAQAMDFVSALLQTCKVWNIFCNTDLQAAKTAYKTIFAK